MITHFSSTPPPAGRPPRPGSRWLAAALAGVALAGSASAVRAATITVAYSTAGTFAVGTNTNPNTTASGNSITDNKGTLDTSDDISITFAGGSFSETVDFAPTSPEPSTFGTFTTTGASSAFSGAEFTLSITQTQPATGSGTSTADVFTMQVTSQLSFNGAISFNPNPVAVAAGGVVVNYQLNDPVLLANNGTTTLAGSITAVPTPAAAGAGLAVMGVVCASRRRMPAVL